MLVEAVEVGVVSAGKMVILQEIVQVEEEAEVGTTSVATVDKKAIWRMTVLTLKYVESAVRKAIWLLNVQSLIDAEDVGRKAT